MRKDNQYSSKHVPKGRKKRLLALIGITLFLLLVASVLPAAFFLKSPLDPQGMQDLPVATAESNQKYPNDHDNSNMTMPQWMKDYFQWHAAARLTIQHNPEAWKSFRFLMLQCLPGSFKCGGTADRLKPLPLILWMAHTSQRVVLIKWGRPAPLEAFLLPPKDGMDWRVPDWLFAQQEFRQGPRATNVEELQEMTANPDFIMVKARVQTHDHGSLFYNSNCRTNNSSSEPTFEQVFHHCWQAVFTPSPPVARLIEQQLEESRLVPGHYVGIHVRALYAVKDRDPNLIRLWTRNAINCASQLWLGGPFYLSSDSTDAIAVGKEYGKERQVDVVSRTTTGQPYHLDKAPRSAKASDFYDTFVDLYLLALSRCITYNMGGFGTFALYVSPFAMGSCSSQHHEASGIHQCEWLPGNNDSGLMSKPMATMRIQRTAPLFLPPMT
jgi:hypothetical protein